MTSRATESLASLPYDRTLMNQVRSGKGNGVKKLRNEILANPQIAAQFFKERGVDIENGKQREKMMWVKDANSRVRRVEGEGRDYTNPMNVHCVPSKAFVAAAKANSAKGNGTSACNGLSLFN